MLLRSAYYSKLFTPIYAAARSQQYILYYILYTTENKTENSVHK